MEGVEGVEGKMVAQATRWGGSAGAGPGARAGATRDWHSPVTVANTTGVGGAALRTPLLSLPQVPHSHPTCLYAPPSEPHPRHLPTPLTPDPNPTCPHP